MAGVSQYALEQVVTGTLYVALFTAEPNFAGGGTECSYSTYARVSHAVWVTSVAAEYAERRNSGAITWPAPVAAKVEGVGWWGIFDAAVGGNLLAWGPFLDGGGEPTTFEVPVGDQTNIIDQDLRIRVT